MRGKLLITTIAVLGFAFFAAVNVGAQAVDHAFYFYADEGMFRFHGEDPNPNLTVGEGEMVSVALVVGEDVEGEHSFAIEELDVSTDTLEAGEVDTITFEADKAGEFKYFNGADEDLREAGMEGVFVVVDAEHL